MCTSLYDQNTNIMIQYSRSVSFLCDKCVVYVLGLNILYLSQGMIKDQAQQEAMFSPLHGHVSFLYDKCVVHVCLMYMNCVILSHYWSMLSPQLMF